MKQKIKQSNQPKRTVKKPQANAANNKVQTVKSNADTTSKAVASSPPKESKNKKEFPKRFPFWARLKIGKKRTTLVIDSEPVKNKRTKKEESGFVHREATHTESKDVEKIEPNPDKTDSKPMYLKRPRKIPQRLVKPHNKELVMPEHLKKRYEDNNDKKK